MQNTGKSLHAEAAKAREEGRLEESLQIIDKALIAYDAEQDDSGFAEGLGCRSITLRLLSEQAHSRRLLLLAKQEMLTAVIVLKESNKETMLAVPLSELGKVFQSLGEYTEAARAFKQALDIFNASPEQSQDRPAVRADMEIHLAMAEYLAGDTSAREEAEEALETLQQTDEKSQFNKDVWVSGGHMHLAEMFWKSNVTKAKEHLDQAKTIIDANPELVIRKKQWDVLARKIKSVNS